MGPTNMGVCPITFPVTGTVEPFRFVGTNLAQAGAGANTLGVNQHYAQDEDTAVDTLGVVSVEAGAAVTAGGLVESDASGRAINKTSGAAVARALDAASAAGEKIRCVLLPN